ncbi:right-handed parallel beta-helix repeat-containing protein [Kitasatospora gansuensis]
MVALLAPPSLSFSCPGGIIKTRSAALVAAILLGALAAPVTATAAPHLYVDNNAGAHCTDAGTGLQSAPYCTVQAAADHVVAYQTVHIAEGHYPEQVTLTRSGTAEAPITFLGGEDRLSPDWSFATLGGTHDNDTPHAMVITGASHLVLNGLNFQGSSGESLLIDGASDVTITRSTAERSRPRTRAILLTNASEQITFARSLLGSLVLNGGTRNTTVTGSEINSLEAYESPGTVVVNTNVNSSCNEGISLTGDSRGATIKNTVIDTGDHWSNEACSPFAPTTGIRVVQNSTYGTTIDYNVIKPVNGAGTAYYWGEERYLTQLALTDGTGQGAHDFVADPAIGGSWSGPQLSPVVDSADETALGILPVDRGGRPAGDDPVIPNTGTGSGFRDRGAWEFADFGSLYTPTGPTRILDTREGIGGPTATVKPGTSIDLQVAGVAGVPAQGVTAVTLNVTVDRTTSGGYLTVYPHGQSRPSSSNLNWTAGTTIPNLVTVPVIDGKVSFYSGSGGPIDVIADLAGYYSSKGSVFTPAGPTRMLDTREGVGGPTAPVKPGTSVDLQVAGVAGVPAKGVTAVTLNVTVDRTAAAAT